MPRGIYPRKGKLAMSKTIDVVSEEIEGREREFKVADVAQGKDSVIEIAPVDVLKDRGALDSRLFMQEELDVLIHEPVNDSESDYVFVGVNGDALWLRRGGTYKLKRYHVAVLAQAKSGRVHQRKHIEPDGSQSYVNSEVMSLMYPFSVLHDPNPKGAVWLQQTMKQAG